MTEKIISNKKDIQRVSTYINGFDEKMEGGIPLGHITLIAGAAGTMKSSICFNVLFNEALKNNVGLYLSLEQSYSSLINHMINMDYDMNKINVVILSDISKLEEQIQIVKDSKNGALIICDLGTLRKQVVTTEINPSGDWINVIKNVVKKITTVSGLDHFVLDSLSALYALSKFRDPRINLFHIFEFLRDMDVTSFLISEMPLDRSKYSEFGIEDYLADGIISLELTHREKKEATQISIVKMRTTNCVRDLFILRKDSKGFHAMSKIA